MNAATRFAGGKVGAAFGGEAARVGPRLIMGSPRRFPRDANRCRTTAERERPEMPVDGKVRNVVVLRFVQQPDHPVAIPGCRLEQEIGTVGPVDDPGMLPPGVRFGRAAHPPDYELDVYPGFGQLAPGPQGEVFTVAATKRLERAGVLPKVALFEEVVVRDVLAIQKPLHHFVDRSHADRALAVQVVGEMASRPWSERLRGYGHRHPVPWRLVGVETGRQPLESREDSSNQRGRVSLHGL